LVRPANAKRWCSRDYFNRCLDQCGIFTVVIPEGSEDRVFTRFDAIEVIGQGHIKIEQGPVQRVQLPVAETLFSTKNIALCIGNA